jgi:hypothetical protein
VLTLLSADYHLTNNSWLQPTDDCLTTDQRQSHFTTGGIPPTSWRQSFWGSRPDFITVRQFRKEIRVRVRVTLRLAVHRQSVRLGTKPLETHDQRFLFWTEPLWIYSLCNILSDERMGLPLMNMLGLCQVYISHNLYDAENSSLCTIMQVHCQSRLCKIDHVYLTYVMLQRQLSHLNGRKLDPIDQSQNQSKSYVTTDGKSLLVSSTRLRLKTRFYYCHTVQSQSQSYFTTGGSPPISSSWHQASWDSWPEIFLTKLNSWGHSVHVMSSLTRESFCLLWMCLGLWSICIAHMACHWKFFLSHYKQVLCQSRLCKAYHAYFTYLMLQLQLSQLNFRKLDHCQIQATYIFYIWLRLVLY